MHVHQVSGVHVGATTIKATRRDKIRSFICGICGVGLVALSEAAKFLSREPADRAGRKVFAICCEFIYASPNS
eukprot:333063-Pyramimonas_sp.AAC.1